MSIDLKAWKKKKQPRWQGSFFYNLYNIYIIMNMGDSYIPHFWTRANKWKRRMFKKLKNYEFCVTSRITINKFYYWGNWEMIYTMRSWRQQGFVNKEILM
jgi:hypothetical protein